MNKILVVIDMQNDFIDGVLGTSEAKAIVEPVINKIKEYQKQNYSIYFTKDTHDAQYKNTQEGKKLPVLHCIKGTQGFELEPKINALYEEIKCHTAETILFEKNTFGSEALGASIKKRYNEPIEIELIGLCTDICVITNAFVLKTILPEAVIKVDSSCCAGTTPLAHQTALCAMKQCQIEIL